LVALAGLAVVSTASAIDLALPNRSGSVKFAVLGDFGSGESSEYEVAAQIPAFRARFPLDFVITTGDIIGSQDEPADFAEKFERPFQALLGRGSRSTRRSVTTTRPRIARMRPGT
jgi:hypothetical protein